MTQANSRPTLSLQLTALQLSDNGSLGKFALSRRQTADSSQTRLRVYPGEPSEILLRLFNQSEASLTVPGENFPLPISKSHSHETDE